MTKVVASKSVDKLKWFIALSVFAAAVVGNSYFVEVAFLYRVLGVVFLFIVGLGILSITSFGSNAIKLMRESSASQPTDCVLRREAKNHLTGVRTFFTEACAPCTLSAEPRRKRIALWETDRRMQSNLLYLDCQNL